MIAAGTLGYIIALTFLFNIVLALIAADGEDKLRAIGQLLSNPSWMTSTAIFAAIFAASQALFLLPIIRFRPPLGSRRKSLTFSLLMAVFVGGFICLALLGGILDLACLILSPPETSNYKELLDRTWIWPVVAVAIVGSWILWGFLMFVHSRQLWADKALGRWIGILLSGTAIELGIIIPIDIMVRRRTDCYCTTGTFWSLCISALAIFWLSGPGIFIAMTGKRRRMFRERHCDLCGFEKGPTPGEKCPECGYAWR